MGLSHVQSHLKKRWDLLRGNHCLHTNPQVQGKFLICEVIEKIVGELRRKVYHEVGEGGEEQAILSVAVQTTRGIQHRDLHQTSTTSYSHLACRLSPRSLPKE
jgi:hypothetical protein